MRYSRSWPRHPCNEAGSPFVRGWWHPKLVCYGDLLLPAVGVHGSEKQLADSVLGDLTPYFCVQREVPGRYPTGQAVRLDAVLQPRDPGPWFDDAPVLGVEFKSVDAAAGYRDDVAATRQAVDYSYCEFDGYGRLGIFLCPSPVLHYLRSANDVSARYAALAAEEGTIEYHRKMTAAIWRAAGLTEAELAAKARASQWQAARSRRAIEAGARAEGFRSAAHREQGRLLGQAGFLVRMMGGFGVGELMQHRTLGWTLLRSGQRLWSQQEGPAARRPVSLRPRLGSG